MIATHPTAPRAGALLLLLSQPACAWMSPDYQRPQVELKAQYGTQTATAAAAQLGWEDFVVDPQLKRLVHAALAHNHNLKQARLSVDIMAARYRIQRSARLPTVGVQGQITAAKVPASVSQTGASYNAETYSVGLGMAAYELDFFGRVASLSDAALERYLASEDGLRSTQLALISQVITAYLNWSSALAQRALVEETLESREASLAIAKAQFEAGATTQLQYQNTLGLTASARAQLQQLARAAGQAKNALSLLSGLPEVTLNPPTGPAVLEDDLQAGLPSQLIARRPDISAAEHQLKAANANIGAARAAFFPSINLTAQAGSQSAELSGLFAGDSWGWSLSPSINLPIFTYGRNQANLEVAKLQNEQRIAAYELTVRTAFNEVSDALLARQTLTAEAAARAELAAASGESLRLSKTRYEAGADSQLVYLDAARQEVAARLGLIQTQTQRQIALVQLFKALGGGWSAPQAAEEAP